MKAMCSTCHVRKVVYISEYFLVVMILKTSLMVKSNIENYVRCEVVDGVKLSTQEEKVQHCLRFDIITYIWPIHVDGLWSLNIDDLYVVHI